MKFHNWIGGNPIGLDLDIGYPILVLDKEEILKAPPKKKIH